MLYKYYCTILCPKRPCFPLVAYTRTTNIVFTIIVRQNVEIIFAFHYYYHYSILYKAVRRGREGTTGATPPSLPLLRSIDNFNKEHVFLFDFIISPICDSNRRRLEVINYYNL